jgi:hypothetical protein
MSDREERLEEALQLIAPNGAIPNPLDVFPKPETALPIPL